MLRGVDFSFCDNCFVFAPVHWANFVVNTSTDRDFAHSSKSAVKLLAYSSYRVGIGVEADGEDGVDAVRVQSSLHRLPREGARVEATVLEQWPTAHARHPRRERLECLEEALGSAELELREKVKLCPV